MADQLGNLSSVVHLDNLTTSIVMVSFIRKPIPTKDFTNVFAGMIVIAANAGGAMGAIGDVTTTMFWRADQHSEHHDNFIHTQCIVVCGAIDLSLLHSLKGELGEHKDTAHLHMHGKRRR